VSPKFAVAASHCDNRATCGTKLTLFFVFGVAAFALLIASYLRRTEWIACCSTAISITALIGGVFLSTSEDHPNQAPAALIWLAGQLPILENEHALDDPISAIAQGSIIAACDAKKRPGCTQAMEASTTISSLKVKRNVKAASETPVTWLLDELRPLVSPGIAPGFVISGINVSDTTLKEVHGTLKPVATQRELKLALYVQGNKLEDRYTIPAGSRFSLGLGIGRINSQNPVGGAIFVFRYIYAGQQTALFWYLTPSMIARFGTRQAEPGSSFTRRE
jgi:hypothetical protein